MQAAFSYPSFIILEKLFLNVELPVDSPAILFIIDWKYRNLAAFSSMTVIYTYSFMSFRRNRR